jgi:hypothetical protein
MPALLPKQACKDNPLASMRRFPGGIFAIWRNEGLPLSRDLNMRCTTNSKERA